MTRRLQGAAIALLFSLASLAMPRSGRATPGVNSADLEARATPAARSSVPPLPPEYLVQDEGWIRVAYHPSARERVRTLAEHAGAFRTQIREELGADVLSSIEVRIAAAVPFEMDRLSPAIPGGSEAAVTFAELHLIVMSPPSPLALDPPSLADTLRRELAILALDEAISGSPEQPGDGAKKAAQKGGAPAPRAPLWFREGYAIHVAGDHKALRAQTLCMASLRGHLLSLAELSSGMPSSTPQTSIAYAEAADFIRFLTQPSSKGRFAALIKAMRSGEPLERALATAYAEGPAELELAWRKDMAQRYSFLPVLLGCTILLATAWIAVAARRARRARSPRPILVRHARRPEPQERVRAVIIPTNAALAASRVRAAQRESAARGEAPPPDADIPKVEHDGQWHTLH